MRYLFKLTSNNSGIALLMTLWVLVMLSVIAMNFSFSTRWGSASARNFKEETKAYYLAMSGYQESLSYLLSDKDKNIDFIDGEGNFHLDNETPSITGRRVIDEAEIEIKLSDEDSKININTATDTRFKQLFDYVGIPADAELEVIDCILDWRDKGDGNLQRANGAESDYYESLSPPYKAKNYNLDVIEELLLVKGFKLEYLYGSEEIRPVKDFITAVGDGAMNINTVSVEIMEMMGINQVDIDTVLKQRTIEIGGARQIPSSFASAGSFRTASYNFRIEVTAGMNGSNEIVKIIAIVKRTPTSKGFDIQTVYWRESIESRSS